MLASMSEGARDTPALNWSDLGVSELLPTGTVTLLLADVEGSTRLWETQPEEMMAAIARLDCIVCEVIAAHDGVRPVEQGEGDSFVVAFGRASDAVARALALQRAPLAPIRLRIGVHTGEVQLRDEGNYIGPTVNRTARLRDLAQAARPCSRAPPEIWWSTGSRPTPGRPIWAHTRYGIYASGTGGAAMPSRSSQRVSAAADARNRCRPDSSGAVHEFRGPRSRNERRAADPGR